MRTVFFALTVSFLACGDSNNSTTDARPVDAAGSGQHDGPGSGSGSGSGSGMLAIPLPAEANGLYWDASSSTLYLTQKTTGSGNAFAKWTDAGGLEAVASFDALGATNAGGIVKLADGSFLTPNFSSTDTDNGVIQIVGSAATLLPEANGSGAAAAGTYRSIGITLGSDGTSIYQASFTKGAATAGFVLETAIGGGSATQSVVAQSGGSTTLQKLVGIVAESDGTLIVSDQTSNTIWQVSTAGAVTTLATYIHPDLVAILPNGDLLDGGGSAVNRIAYPAGTVTPVTFAGLTFTYVAGMAYDATNHRLFVFDENGTGSGSGAGGTIDVVPYTP